MVQALGRDVWHALEAGQGIGVGRAHGVRERAYDSPMGASTETVAWIAAGGAVAGALIGSAAGGVVSYMLERARDRRRALAGARLVRLDLSLTASAIRDAEGDKKWWVFRDVDAIPAWAEYADTLSGRLSPEEFEDVTQSVSELTRFAREIQKAPRGPDEPYWWALPTAMIDQLVVMRENATKAYDALANVAKDKPVQAGQLLHDDQMPT
jgi:hypothetical protein